MTISNARHAVRSHATSHASKDAGREALKFLSPRPDQDQSWGAHERAPISLDEAFKRVLASATKDGTRSDRIVDMKAYGFGSVDMETMQIAALDGSEAPISLRAHAFGQLATSIGVPASYVRTLPAKLAIANMNWGLANVGESRPSMLRLAGGEARAILSDRYAPMDDADLLEIVDRALLKSGFRADAMVRSTVFGPTMMLRITIPSGAIEVKRGDLIEWGIDICNSEMGLRSIQVTPMTYRLVCTNGARSAIAESTTRLRHVGDPRRVRDAVAAIVPTAFAEARGDMAKWRKSVDVLIDNALSEIEGLRSFGVAVGEAHSIGRTLLSLPQASEDELTKALKGFRTTAFDVANAVTQTARDRGDVGARLKLEETGHRYLNKRAG